YPQDGTDLAIMVAGAGAGTVFKVGGKLYKKIGNKLKLVEEGVEDASRVVDDVADASKVADDVADASGSGKLKGNGLEDSEALDVDGINLPDIPGQMSSAIQKIPERDYLEIKSRSVHNPDSDSLVLGKYRPTITDDVEDWNVPGADSYVAIAREENATYFDLGSEWDAITSKYDMTGDEMFEAFNIPVLDDAVSSGKQIKFTHDPRTNGGFLQQEWEYLQDTHGYNRLVEIDGVWYAK
ncbi:MAG: hypothetical protein P8X74_19545, partial [Reinekea sp.]